MNEPVDPAAGIRVRVTDLKSSDALMFEDNDGQPVLLIARNQPFASAVDSVQRAMEISKEQAERIVRTHYPEAVEWGEQDIEQLLHDLSRPAAGADQTCPAPTEKKTAERTRLRLVPRWAVTAIAAVTALGIGYGMPRQSASVHAAPKSVPDRSADASNAQPYTSDSFQEFAADGEMACTPTGPLKARCVDVDGKTMASEASIGSDWTSFAFTYDEGKNRIELRVFASEAAARQWTDAESSKASMPNLVQIDRYALWGTDAHRLGEYLKLLQDQDADGPSAMPTPSARPARASEHQAEPDGAVNIELATSATQVADVAGPEPQGATSPAAIPITYVPVEGAGAKVRLFDEQVAQKAEDAQPMPRRLAVLALGTLNISPTGLPKLEQATTLRDMGTLVAVNIIMGREPVDTGIPAGELPIVVTAGRKEVDPPAVPKEPVREVPERETDTAAPRGDGPVEESKRTVVEPDPTPTPPPVSPTPPPPSKEVELPPTTLPVEEKPPVTPPPVEPPVEPVEPPVDVPRDSDGSDPSDHAQDTKQTPDGAADEGDDPVPAEPSSASGSRQDLDALDLTPQG
ncbi:hypothetical protein [Streptomyces sp. MBT27]|uniref:hypothetical protein n=1 Tax=Streptomyces sp. MBT27 TaxID=1488356 RepID=UPI0014236683|nr:hypothetical protein [Streptomyces sp. MBT27]